MPIIKAFRSQVGVISNPDNVMLVHIGNVSD